MTQIKIFKGSIENKVNAFLQENDGRIVVKDIKFVAHLRDNYDGPVYSFAMTAMIVYEIAEPAPKSF